MCYIRGFQTGVAEVPVLLRYYTISNGKQVPTFRRSLNSSIFRAKHSTRMSVIVNLHSKPDCCVFCYACVMDCLGAIRNIWGWKTARQFVIWMTLLMKWCSELVFMCYGVYALFHVTRALGRGSLQLLCVCCWCMRRHCLCVSLDFPLMRLWVRYCSRLLECDILCLVGGWRCAVYSVSKLLSVLAFHVCIFRWY